MLEYNNNNNNNNNGIFIIIIIIIIIIIVIVISISLIVSELQRCPGGAPSGEAWRAVAGEHRNTLYYSALCIASSIQTLLESIFSAPSDR